MTAELWNMPVRTFLDAIASTSPTPGGGSVANVSGAFGIGLILMALRISAPKNPSIASGPLLVSGESLMHGLAEAAEEDIRLFDGFVAALRLPKSTDEDRDLRRDALSAAAVAATEGPLRAAGIGLDALDIGIEAWPLVNESVRSDVAAGWHLLAAAVRAVLLNVEPNLGWIKDDTLRAKFPQRKNEILARLEAVTARFAVLEPKT
jgi:formiminotetrahydrofolate cyclodeaminase